MISSILFLFAALVILAVAEENPELVNCVHVILISLPKVTEQHLCLSCLLFPLVFRQVSQYFDGMSSLNCQGSMILPLHPLKMKAVCSFKTLVHNSLLVWLHIPEDLNSHMFWYCLARLIWLWFGCIKLVCVGVVELLC